MRIASGTGPIDTTALGRVVETDAARATQAAPEAQRLQSAVLQPALAAMRAMPDIDHEKVAALRDALAKGELPFDPAKLAGLIQRFHGGQP